MKRIFFKNLLNLTVVFFVLIITACNKLPSPSMSNAQPHPLTPYQHSLVTQARASGAKVIKQADVLHIVLPTDTFFRRNTTRIKRHKLEALNSITLLVKSYVAPYRHPRITITGYTDTVFARMTRQKLSTEYAKEIAAYLWHQGIAQRWLRVRGAGAASPIASNRTPYGSAYNRRVVIRIN